MIRGAYDKGGDLKSGLIWIRFRGFGSLSRIWVAIGPTTGFGYSWSGSGDGTLGQCRSMGAVEWDRYGQNRKRINKFVLHLHV